MRKSNRVERGSSKSIDKLLKAGEAITNLLAKRGELLAKCSHLVGHTMYLHHQLLSQMKYFLGYMTRRGN